MKIAKTLMLIVCLLIMLAQPALARDNDTSTLLPLVSQTQINEVNKALNDWTTAIKSNDPEKVTQLYAKDAVLLPTVSPRILTTYIQRISYFYNLFKKLPEAECIIQGKPNTWVFNDIAVTSGFYDFVSKSNPVKARFSFVYKKNGQSWEIVEHHSSVLPPASDDDLVTKINSSNNSFVNFGTKIGQFGTKDFTVAFSLKTTEKYRYFDLAGNRTAGSHGNFLSIRETGKHESMPEGIVVAELDQDQNGTNYIAVQSQATGLNDGKWHHIAVVRNGTLLKLYIDGVSSGNGSAQGVANINNGNPFKLGRSLVGVHDKFAADAGYKDFDVYDSALSDQDVLNLFSSTRLP